MTWWCWIHLRLPNHGQPFKKPLRDIRKSTAGHETGGSLVGSWLLPSCTNLVQPDLFLKSYKWQLKMPAGKYARLPSKTQSADHPIVWGWENTHYLKFLIVQVLNHCTQSFETKKRHSAFQIINWEWFGLFNNLEFSTFNDGPLRSVNWKI